jgi:hypothetical protein
MDQTIEERLTRLERSNRRLKRLIGALALAGAAPPPVFSVQFSGS